jgi:hypothetical protein
MKEVEAPGQTKYNGLQKKIWRESESGGTFAVPCQNLLCKRRPPEDVRAIVEKEDAKQTRVKHLVRLRRKFWRRKKLASK